jgi:acetoin utilization protein AcuB
MLVKNWMSKPAITIESDATIQDALGLLKKHSIHILPVMEEERLVGIVTGSDLKSASVSDVASLEIHDLLDLISRIRVKMVMNKEPISVPYDYTMEETAIKFFVHNISGAPVVDQVGKVVGVVTKNDLFRVFISLTGISKKGIHFAFKLPDRPGSIKEVTDMIRNHGGRIASMLSTREKIEKGYFKVYIRAYGLDSSARQRLKQTIKETLPLVYIIDHTENVREIFEQE